jgi:hypothetical protein
LRPDRICFSSFHFACHREMTTEQFIGQIVLVAFNFAPKGMKRRQVAMHAAQHFPLPTPQDGRSVTARCVAFVLAGSAAARTGSRHDSSLALLTCSCALLHLQLLAAHCTEHCAFLPAGHDVRRQWLHYVCIARFAWQSPCWDRDRSRSESCFLGCSLGVEHCHSDLSTSKFNAFCMHGSLYKMTDSLLCVRRCPFTRTRSRAPRAMRM